MRYVSGVTKGECAGLEPGLGMAGTNTVIALSKTAYSSNSHDCLAATERMEFNVIVLVC
jgi:hypothetical protein